MQGRRRPWIAAALAIVASCGQQGGNASGSASGGVTIDIPPATPWRNTTGAPAQAATSAPPAAPATAPKVAAQDVPTGPPVGRRAVPNSEDRPDPPPPTASGELANAATTAEQSTQAAAIPAATKLPLPDRVVARTLDRIGYRCGAVTSTAPIEAGGGGAFNIACSSGASYRASTVRGRLKFHHLGRK